MNRDTILVIGGTGMLGEHVAQRLLHDRFAVRLLARDVDRARTLLGDDFEYVVGDVDAAATIARALDGCMGVHISLKAGPDPADLDRVEHRGTVRVAELAVRQGIRRLTYVSQMLVGEGSRIPEHRAKFRAEQGIARSGVPYTIFKPTYVMETLPRHIRGKLALVMGRQPHPLHMVAASDVARMVARSFQTPAAANRTFFVHGPEAITIADALRLYCARLAPKTRVVSLPLWLMAIVATLVARGQLGGTLQLMGALQQAGERGDPAEADSVLGAPTTTVHAWCEQRRTHHA